MTVVVDRVLDPLKTIGSGAYVTATPRMELGVLAPLMAYPVRPLPPTVYGLGTVTYLPLMSSSRDQWVIKGDDFIAFTPAGPSVARTLDYANLLLERLILDRLAEELEQQTAHLSVVRRASRLPTFTALANLGAAGTRVALRRLGRYPSPLWLYFLQYATGERPAAGAESADEATRLWRDWGKQRGLA